MRVGGWSYVLLGALIASCDVFPDVPPRALQAQEDAERGTTEGDASAVNAEDSRAIGDASDADAEMSREERADASIDATFDSEASFQDVADAAQDSGDVKDVATEAHAVDSSIPRDGSIAQDARADAIGSCSDSVKNGTETDVDCGGACRKCSKHQGCGQDSDCESGKCLPSSKCS